MFGGQADPLEDTVRFMRITLLGASGCGKTSLVTSFVSNTYPFRAVSTDQAQIYYRKIDLKDEDEPGKPRACLLEIEDTPGSERGHDTFNDPTSDDPMAIKRGSRVRVCADKREVQLHFQSWRAAKRKPLIYERGMDAMLGGDFTVKTVGDGTFGLVAQEGGDIWEFPAEALHLNLGVSLPIDPYLDTGDKPLKVLTKLKERKQRSAALQRPFSAYTRDINAPNTDTPMSKSRMGYFICFDMSDEDCASLEEAKKVHKMLVKRLSKRQNQKAKPIIWFVGCKGDKTSSPQTVEQNLRAARAYAEDEDMRLEVTAARKHQGTYDIFYEMATLIEHRVALWRYVDDDGDNASDDENDANCCVQ